MDGQRQHASAITWQKDGLLIPVDTRLTTAESVVYVPARSLKEAMERKR